MNRIMMIVEGIRDAESVTELCQIAFACTLFAAIAAAALFVLVLLSQLLFRRWLTAGQLSLLWGLVLLRLLIPAAPESSLSLQNIQLQNPLAVSQATMNSATSRPEQPAYGEAALAAAEWIPTTAGSMSTQPAPSRGLTLMDVLEYAVPLLYPLWLVGTILLLIWTAVVQWRFSRNVSQTSADCKNRRLLDLWDNCKDRAGVPKAVAILLFDGVQQPAVMGLRHPRFLLPTELLKLEDRQLEMIMLHELAHIRRRDIAANWLLILIRAVHWWNPLYWLAASRYQNLREQACDARALEWIGGSDLAKSGARTGYGELLLTLAQRQPAGPGWRVMLPASMLGMISTRFRQRSIRNRIRAISSGVPKPGRLQVVCLVIALIGMGLCGFTDAIEADDERPAGNTTWHRLGGGQLSFSTRQPTVSGPIQNKVYDIKGVISRLVEQEYRESDARIEVKQRISAIVTNVRKTASAEPAETTPETTDFVELKGNQLIVTAPESVHSQIEKQLAVWEHSGLGVIQTTVRLIDFPIELAKRAGIDWQRLQTTTRTQVVQEAITASDELGQPQIRVTSVTEEHLSAVVTRLDKMKAKSFLKLAQGDYRTRMLFSPTITQNNGQQASISKSYQAPIAVARMGKNETGKNANELEMLDVRFQLDVLPVLSPDHREISMSINIDLNKIVDFTKAKSVFAQLETDVESSTSIQDRRNSSSREQIQVQSSLAKSEYLLISCPPTADRKRYLHILISAKEMPIKQQEHAD